MMAGMRSHQPSCASADDSWTVHLRGLFRDYDVLECVHPKNGTSRESTSIAQRLPDEILVRIFRYLEPILDQVPQLALVCKRWRNVLKTSGSIWRNIHVDPTNYEYWHFSMLFCIFRVYGTHIQKLTWKDNALVYESVFALIPKLTSLKCLRLPISWNRVVVESLLPLSNLEDVQINGGYAITDAELQLIAQHFPNIKSISLNACWSVTAYGVVGLFDSLTGLEDVKLKINSGLPLNDLRSEDAMMQGAFVVQSVSDSIHASMVTVLCLHFVSIEMDELWHTISSLTRLKKLSLSNCENLHGIRLVTGSLHKIYLYNLWNVLFVSINAPNLRLATLDQGLESMEHLEMFTPKLRRLQVDGCDALRTINVRSTKLVLLHIDNCSELDMRSFRETLQYNESIVSLKIGRLPIDDLYLNEQTCPNIQELCLLSSFSASVLHLRSPTLRLLHTTSDNDIESLSYIYILANHICKVSLVCIPTMRSITIQCVSIDSVELNLCSDTQMVLEAVVIQAFGSIGFLRLFDCDVKLLSVTSPLVKTLVLYRCVISDYTLSMMLKGCANIYHLCLEKCQNFNEMAVALPHLKYLNLYDCYGLQRLDIDCPALDALNVGHCPVTKIYVKGHEMLPHELDSCVYGRSVRLVYPKQSIRWSHDFPPQVYASTTAT
ncbi:unnamed protein product [Owenia fusiformis]|uniref:Uncharacterized protein n=1 Tax=Owenia fusiformis TaxID=6347 RepID=A0A8J1U7C1_OWEFU|nr:unnamed protein product [Owenia fusiformis]